MLSNFAIAGIVSSNHNNGAVVGFICERRPGGDADRHELADRIVYGRGMRFSLADQSR
jgi:hypothetical protein